MSTVYLVGAGPGDPRLLTLRASELLAQADIIIYDALVSPAIQTLFCRSARLEYVGKRAGHHSMKQEEINALIVHLAYTHPESKIVRLKGGDPFVFGRGGEEMQALYEADIPYEIVPGVTAGISAPAYCGIPVTQRGISRSVTLITAATQEGGLPPLDWEAYARLDGTLVFYMGMRVVPEIARALITAGIDPKTTAGIISQGTTPRQRLLSTPLSSLAEAGRDYEEYSPGLLIVGDVVGWGQDYGWYKVGRLAGERIVVTRSEAQASTLADRLEAEGAEVHLLPSIEIAPIDDYSLLDEAITSLSSFDCIAFTSTNAVKYFFARLNQLGLDSRSLAGLQIAVIGEATAKAVREHGLQPDFTPSVFTAEVMARELPSVLNQGAKVLLPQSALASGVLGQGLRHAGLQTTEIDLYTNHPIDYEAEYLRTLLSSETHWVTLCSSSAVTNFLALAERYGLCEEVRQMRLVAIGEVTARTIREAGYSVFAQPERATIEDMVEEIVRNSLP